MQESAIVCSNIHLVQGNFEMENLDFEVKKGCITGLVGRNGSGKTTLIRLLAGAKVYTSGNIIIDGIPLEENAVEIRKRAVFVFDEPNFSLAVKPDVLAEVMKMMEPSFNMELYQSKMRLFKLDGKEKVKNYSSGMQKKLLLILALARRPEILVLDEPTSEVDPVSRAEMLDMLQEFMENEEHTVLFSTHITSDLDKIADYIAIMDNGKILLTEEKETLRDEYCINGVLPTVEEIMCSILRK
ncbi:MAG: ABC transporter ATP-binding protein [Clostridiaceae bacterium]|nr:ABC transporter ATP-binding protein [Clostridiaceae bacterium]